MTLEQLASSYHMTFDELRDYSLHFHEINWFWSGDPLPTQELKSHDEVAIRAEIEPGIEAFREAMEKFALTCSSCQKLAYPITGTGNRYRCVPCGRQFAAARHNVGFESWLSRNWEANLGGKPSD